MPRRWLPLLLPSSLLLAGCTNLHRFDTSGEAAYCGSLIAAPFITSGLLPEGVTQLDASLELDTSSLDDEPGRLTTKDASSGLCAPQALFVDAPLRTVQEVLHDPLSFVEFGEGRDQNVFAWVDTTCQGTMLAILSLMHDGDVELRLFKPMAAAKGTVPPEQQAGFGVMHFTKRSKGCQP